MKIFSLLVIALIVAALVAWMYSAQLDRQAREAEERSGVELPGPGRVIPRTTSRRPTPREPDEVGEPDLTDVPSHSWPRSTDEPQPLPPPLPPVTEPPVPMPELPSEILAWNPAQSDPLAMAALARLPLPEKDGSERAVSYAAVRAETEPDGFWTVAEPEPEGPADRDLVVGGERETDVEEAVPIRDYADWFDDGIRGLLEDDAERAGAAFRHAIDVSGAEPDLARAAVDRCCAAGQYELAEELRVYWAEHGGTTMGSEYLEGLILMSQDRLGEAATLFSRVAATNPTAWEAQFQLGRIAQTLNDFLSAELYYRNALFEAGDDPSVRYRLGQVLAEQQRFQEAEALFREVLARHPSDRATLSDLGGTLFTQQRYTEALACYRRLVELSPDHLPSRNQMAVTLKRLGRPREALDQFLIGLESHPDSFLLRFNVACTLCAIGRVDEAMWELEQMLEMHPGQIGLYLDDNDLEPLRGRPRFEQIKTRAAELLAEAESPPTTPENVPGS